MQDVHGWAFQKRLEGLPASRAVIVSFTSNKHLLALFRSVAKGQHADNSCTSDHDELLSSSAARKVHGELRGAIAFADRFPTIERDAVFGEANRVSGGGDEKESHHSRHPAKKGGKS
ncbi:hypothetical protein H0241_31490 [Mesorhizobium sp. CCANP35]|uniref:Uncharacterized protein n=2 Tax=Mesorhizobium neociceri TaxID=1307853 RepID=A0A838BDU6_9HYPH|nr:hypothetical protein [Mesorhizobium neociceri]